VQGFAGMYMLHRLRGQGMTARVFEQGSGVGGTWYWNRYPGARCDVESMQYSYSFDEELQQEWDWSERYAPQPEILQYANHVADRFNLRPDIQFDTRVENAAFDETTSLWSVSTSDGKTVAAKFVVLATGCLSNARMPDIKGLDRFKGKVYHTGHWPHEAIDFTGQRVGVIGTGSSAIQSVPIIAEQASQLTVFQRTANFSIPPAMPRLPSRSGKNSATIIPRSGALRARWRRTASIPRCPIAARSTTATTSAARNTRRAGIAAGSPSCRSTTISGSTRRPTTRRRISSAKRSRDRQGPGDGKAVAAEQPSDRIQAYLHRHRVFCDLQSPERDAGGYQIQSDRGDHGECRARGRQGS
jgi:cation diffusion facilitator CzcD-associated flavoprotein CzcO